MLNDSALQLALAAPLLDVYPFFCSGLCGHLFCPWLANHGELLCCRPLCGTFAVQELDKEELGASPLTHRWAGMFSAVPERISFHQI